MTEGPSRPDALPDMPPAATPLPPVEAAPVSSALASQAPAPAPVPDAGFNLGLGVEELGTRARGLPVLGGLAAVFGVAALFKAPLVLGPLGFLFGLAALVRRQFGLGAIGGVSGLVALAISPSFWGLLGLAWAWSWLWGWLSG